MTTNRGTAADPREFLMLILSSPSGAGKTTLCRKLIAEFPDLYFSVSHSTRKPRPAEQDGRDYHFVSPETFDAMVKQDAFAEWAQVHGHRYGTSHHEIEVARRAYRGILFDIDFQGARQIRASYPEAVGVFVVAPTLDELERRLRGRASDDEETVKHRFAKAREEIASYGLFDYVVVNDDLERAYGQIRGIVLAEGCRRDRAAPFVERMLRSR